MENDKLIKRWLMMAIVRYSDQYIRRALSNNDSDNDIIVISSLVPYIGHLFYQG